MAIHLTADKNGERLDSFLCQVIPTLSKRRAKALCTDGLVRVNNSRSVPGTILNQGDQIEVAGDIEPVRLAPELVPEDLRLGKGVPIAYEDEYLIVLEKPRMMHALRQRNSDPLTLADIIAAADERYQESGKTSLEAGLVQRLDFYTSGLAIAAKSPVVWQLLHNALLSGQIVKQYLTLLEGIPPWKERSVTLALDSRQQGRKMVRVSSGLDTTTKFTVKERLETETLVEAVSGRTVRHQIRAHASTLGHPLVGDVTYGATSTLEIPKGNAQEGFFLHAEQVNLFHPVSGKEITVRAERSLLSDK